MQGKAGPQEQLSERENEILARLSAGLSDQQIADELVLSLNTIKWYNRQIYGKLGVSSRTQAAAKAQTLGLLNEGASISPLPVSRHTLPAPVTPFIGRSHEIAEVKQLLDHSRLLTLTGSGGTGKTRLALQVAAEIAEGYADGAAFVDLAPLSDHALVAKAIARALGVFENPAEPLPHTLKRVLTRREMLLLIDNFEHVIQAAPLVSELLAASPGLVVLATSRESLRLAGEQEYFVQPLSLPVAGALPVQNLTQSEAGLLFVRRVQMVKPRFRVNDDNAQAIIQICTRLNGLPLAIELAAARCKLLTPQVLLARLEGSSNDSPLRALAGGPRDAPPRHRTLHDTVAWSYNLLPEDEKGLFARLAVFRGGRSLEAIEAVCAEGLAIDVFDGLASLVDKSLVQQKEAPGGEPRFTLLEMIHEYGRERLEASGEAEKMRRRHAVYFVELAERAEPELRLAHYDRWCERFELELDNIRAALEWSVSGGDLALGVRLASALGLFWYGKGHHVEGIRWTRQLLGRLDEVPALYQPGFLISAGHLAWMVDLNAAQRLFARALDISRELGDKLRVAWALIFKAYTMMQAPEAAIPVAEEGLALFRELDHQPGVAQALNIIGEIARLSGDVDHARQVYEECLAVCRQTGELRRICYMCSNLAYIAQHEDDHERAIKLARQALELARERKDRSDMAVALAVLAGSIGMTGQPQRAAHFQGAVAAALERIGAFHQPGDKPEMDRMITAVRAQLGDATFETAYSVGRQMTLEQAVASALVEQPVTSVR